MEEQRPLLLDEKFRNDNDMLKDNVIASIQKNPLEAVSITVGLQRKISKDLDKAVSENLAEVLEESHKNLLTNIILDFHQINHISSQMVSMGIVRSKELLFMIEHKMDASRKVEEFRQMLLDQCCDNDDSQLPMEKRDLEALFQEALKKKNFHCATLVLEMRCSELINQVMTSDKYKQKKWSARLKLLIAVLLSLAGIAMGVLLCMSCIPSVPFVLAGGAAAHVSIGVGTGVSVLSGVLSMVMGIASLTELQRDLRRLKNLCELIKTQPRLLHQHFQETLQHKDSSDDFLKASLEEIHESFQKMKEIIIKSDEDVLKRILRN